MRKGFKTLAAVACAMFGYQVMAMAPTIREIPDIIVGDAEDASAANIFVFPNAIDLDAIVEDDETDAADIIWSFYSAGGVYSLNSAESVVPGTTDLVNPPAANRIDNQTDPKNASGDPRLVTVRDIVRSPIAHPSAGQGPYPEPAGTGIIDSRVVTLYASDGSTVSLGRSIIVYTDNEGFDRYSPDTPPEEPPIVSYDFTQNAHGWVSASAGPSTRTQSPTSGLCINVTQNASPNTDANWAGPYGAVELVANSVWEARMTVTTDQTTAFWTPLWVLVYDNFGGAAPNTGNNEYGGEFFFHDNEGGANSPIAGIGRSDFRVFMMPTQMQTPQFSNATTGFLQPALADNAKMRTIFRVMHIGTSYGAQNDFGSVCLQSMNIYRHDLANMTVDQNVYEVTSFTNGLTGGTPPPQTGWTIDDSITNNGAVTFTGGNMVVGPRTGTNWNTTALVTVHPGDTTVNFTGVGDMSVNADNWPVTWEENTLYYIEFMLSAPTATDEQNPPDVLRIAADVMTQEMVMTHFATPNTPDWSQGNATLIYRGLSTPRAGAAQKYGAFFYSHTPTNSGMPDSKRWRPRIDILAAADMNPNGRTTNTGSIQVHSVKVEKVRF